MGVNNGLTTSNPCLPTHPLWIPAFAGMTELCKGLRKGSAHKANALGEIPPQFFLFQSKMSKAPTPSAIATLLPSAAGASRNN